MELCKDDWKNLMELWEPGVYKNDLSNRWICNFETDTKFLFSEHETQEDALNTYQGLANSNEKEVGGFEE